MNQKEIDIQNFENELLNTRKKLNDLIYTYSQEDSASGNRNPDSKAFYKEKIKHLEAELNYMNGQLQRMKQSFNEVEAVKNYDYGNIQPNAVQMNVMQPKSHKYDNINPNTVPNAVVLKESTPTETPHPHTYRNPQDYEKIFGKNFMGIFASVLIFISLIIFATLVLPYLSNTIKMIGLYLVSFAILGAGLIFYKKNTSNKFYIALIGCGAGALYITLLLSDLYFKAIGDIALYIFILLWAVFIKYLTKIKNLVFTIIGQSGIFISTILGTALCVREQDILKFLVLVIFYLPKRHCL